MNGGFGWLLTGGVLVSLSALHAAEAPPEEKLPPLWGYGVNSCAAYVQAADEREQAPDEYRRYQDWLTGFVSGLDLATGQDVLVGVEIKAAMRRIGLYCDENPKDDFFTGTMDLVRLLSQLK